MNDVHRTTQRRRGFAWPILTGLATVAAAVAVVVIGLGLINQPNGIGSEPSPSPRRAPRRRRHRARRPRHLPQSSRPRPQPSSRRPGTANSDRSTLWIPRLPSRTDRAARLPAPSRRSARTPTSAGRCRSPRAGIRTTTPTRDRPARCLLPSRSRWRLTGPTRSRLRSARNLPPGGDFSTSKDRRHRVVHRGRCRGRALRDRGVVGGRVRESRSGRLLGHRDRGNLPAEGNDQPYLMIATGSSDPDELAMLDRHPRPDGGHARHQRVGSNGEYRGGIGALRLRSANLGSGITPP